jgi:hypothetical protein
VTSLCVRAVSASKRARQKSSYSSLILLRPKPWSNVILKRVFAHCSHQTLRRRCIIIRPTFPWTIKNTPHALLVPAVCVTSVDRWFLGTIAARRHGATGGFDDNIFVSRASRFYQFHRVCAEARAHPHDSSTRPPRCSYPHTPVALVLSTPLCPGSPRTSMTITRVMQRCPFTPHPRPRGREWCRTQLFLLAQILAQRCRRRCGPTHARWPTDRGERIGLSPVLPDVFPGPTANHT